MTTSDPKLASQITLPPVVGNDPLMQRLHEAIANRDKEIAERIEELDDLVSAFPGTAKNIPWIVDSALADSGFDFDDLVGAVTTNTEKLLTLTYTLPADAPSSVRIDPRFSGALAYLTANEQLVHDTAKVIPWDAQYRDTDAFWEGVTNPSRHTIPEAGDYVLKYHLVVNDSPDDADGNAAWLEAWLKVNGTRWDGTKAFCFSENIGHDDRNIAVNFASPPIDFALNDYIEVEARQGNTESSNENVIGHATLWYQAAWFSIERVA